MFAWTISLKEERSAGWYSVAGIVALSLVLWGFIEAIYALSVVVIIFVGVYLLINNNAPETVEVDVNENGIGIGSDFYDYPKIEDFAIVYDDGKPVILRIRLNVRGIRIIDIDLPEDAVNAADLRAFLSEYATESKNTDLGTLERITRMLGL